jgi:hypothetical protein
MELRPTTDGCFDDCVLNVPKEGIVTNLLSNEDFFKILRSLIEKWCDRRCLRALHRILGAYLGFNGMTEEWGELRTALNDVRTLAKNELTADELKVMVELIKIADRALTPRKP